MKPGLVEVAFFFSAGAAGWSHHFLQGEEGALDGDPGSRRVEQQSGEEGALDGDEGAKDGDYGTLAPDVGTFNGDGKYIL